MHTIVGFIPLLLHLSLLLFFAGLVAFLRPINQVMVYQCLWVVLYWSPKSLWDEEKGQKDDTSPQCDNQQPKWDEEGADREHHRDNRSIPTSLITVMNQHATVLYNQMGCHHPMGQTQFSPQAHIIWPWNFIYD
ncbi:hypothetical protein B0H14DRAFT_2635517 [Mycena olivaceomarginata]|nr:hypothetical protein B0H14DRAFT_2635517 [Mycena olivaceomarginata]